jgi:hypothetical protein
MILTSKEPGTLKRSAATCFAQESSLWVVAVVPGRQGRNSVQARPGELHLSRPSEAPKTTQPSSRLKHNAIVAG